MKFYIVDAFTDEIFGGNPAGVVLLDKDSPFPDDDRMRKTAAELRYSETAFIRQVSENEFQIRYFTPVIEIDLCGHATIGSYTALQAEGIVNSNGLYINDTLAGRLNIEITNGSIMMDMSQPEYIGLINDAASLEELYTIMGLPVQKVYWGSQKQLLSPEIISTGVPDIMLPVGSKANLERINPDFDSLSRLSERYKVTGVHAFTIGDDNITAYCRNFAPLYDIDEESATGTSNGALTYYFYRKGMITEGNINTFLQGESMGRPSMIYSRLQFLNDLVRIQVGGKGKILASGNIYL